MVNLSLVELNYPKQKKQTTNKLSNYGTYGFITSFSNNSAIEAKEVTKKILTGNYNLKSKYTIIYLYNFAADGVSTDFIKSYGGKLHNASSSNITILTYYSPDMVDEWTNVQFREELNCDRSNSAFTIPKIIEDLKEFYEVKEIPAMIVVKKEKEQNEKYCIIETKSKNKEELYSLFKHVMDTINDNCEEDFSVIARKCGSTPKKGPLMSAIISNICTYNYIYDLVKKESKDRKYSQTILAGDLGISERTLRNKRAKNTFTWKECICMGIIFDLTVDEINGLLAANDHRDLDRNGIDIVKACNTKKNDSSKEIISIVNEELRERGFFE